MRQEIILSFSFYPFKFKKHWSKFSVVLTGEIFVCLLQKIIIINNEVYMSIARFDISLILRMEFHSIPFFEELWKKIKEIKEKPVLCKLLDHITEHVIFS